MMVASPFLTAGDRLDTPSGGSYCPMFQSVHAFEKGQPDHVEMPLESRHQACENGTVKIVP